MNTQKRSYAILGFAGITSLVALILGIVAVAKKVMMGMVSVFDSQWSNMPSNSILTHRNAIMGLGLAALIVGLLLLIAIGFVAFKQYKGSDANLNLVIGFAALAIIVLVLGSIAMAYNSDLNDAVWLAKETMQIANSFLAP